MTSARLRPFLPGAIAIVLLGLASCHKGKSGDDAQRKKHAAVPVEVVQAQRTVAPRTVNVISVLYGRKQADVFSKVPGRVSYIGPREGERVKAGQLLFRIDRSDPGESYLMVPVTSPIDGWVGRWIVLNTGTQVSPTDPIVTVVDDAALRATVFMPQDDWVEVNKDTHITVKVGDEERTAHVVAIARAADPASGRGSIEIELPNEARTWRAGMVANVRIDLSPKPRILVSATSIAVTDAGNYLFVVDHGQAKRVAVKFRLIDNDTAEVLSGLAPDTPVITAGSNLVGNDTPVTIVTKKAH